MTALSVTVLVMAPLKQNGCVAVHASGRHTEGTVPTEPLKPKHWHHEEGILMEPPPSEPSEMGSMPSATAAAEPPEEPPELYSVLKGFHVGP